MRMQSWLSGQTDTHTCISISDGVLIQGCSWVVFGECPLCAGSLFTHSSYLLLFIFIVHTQSKDVFVIFVVLCLRLYTPCLKKNCASVIF